MKVILVAGGAGFIGSNFIKYFLVRNKNFIIVNIDKQAYPFDSGRLAALENSPRYHHVKGDVCNQDLTEYVLRKYRPSWIVNFCSEPEQAKDGRRFSYSNDSSYAATHSLLEGANYIWGRVSPEGKRFLQISSDTVYGLNNDSSEYINEESRLMPVDPYSAMKAGADLMVESYHKAFGLPSIILRSCNIYGPWQGKRSLIPSMIRSILEDRQIEVTSPENQIREWMHVADLCSAIVRALFFAKPGEIYNAGSGESSSEADLARILLNLAGKPEDSLRINPDRRQKAGFCLLNSYKARCNLRWAVSYRLDEGLENTLNWYKQNSTALS